MTSCLTGFSVAKIGGLVGGTAATAALAGPIMGGTFGDRVAFTGFGVLGGSLVGAFAGQWVGPYLPATGPGEALSAAGGVLVTYFGKKEPSIKDMLVIGGGSAAAYFIGCRVAGAIDGQMHK